MAKMTGFKVFNGTKAAFESKASQYADAIVFISGGTDSKGSCIFAQGMYFGNFAEFLAAINYVKGVKVGDSQYNATAGGGYIPFAAADNSTVALNVENGTITVGLTEAFVNKVNDTASNLGSKEDAASSTGSAFARIANLAAIVGQLTGSEGGELESVEGQITNAINALRTEIVGTLDTADAKTLAAINDELDGLDGKYAALEPRVKAIEDDYLKAADKTELEGKIKVNTDAIAVLNGNDTVDGSVDKKIKTAINDFATKVTDNNTIDTIKELVDYVAGVDGSDKLSNAIAQINDNTGAIETLNGNASTAGSVDKKVKDAIDAEVERANGAYATKAQGEKADTAYQKPSDGIPSSDLASGVQTSLGKADSAIQSVSGDAFINAENSGDDVRLSTSVGSVESGTENALATCAETKSYVDSLWEWEVIS